MKSKPDMYEDIWSRYLARIRELIGSGDRNILSILNQTPIGDMDASSWRSWEWTRRPHINEIVLRGLEEAGAAFSPGGYPAERIEIHHGRYLKVNHLSLKAVFLSYVMPETQAVVELGAGSGAQLFLLYYSNKSTLKSKRFIAGEITEAGREAISTLAALDPDLDMRVHHFDFTAPSFDFLDELDSVLVFTHHAVEQIPELPEQFFEELLGVAANVTCVHAEPIGWQQDEGLVEKRRTGDADFFAELKEQLGLKLNDPQQVIRNAAWWSWFMNYNINLHELITHFEASGDIEIVERYRDCFGRNPFSPLSLMVWRKK